MRILALSRFPIMEMRLSILVRPAVDQRFEAECLHPFRGVAVFTVFLGEMGFDRSLAAGLGVEAAGAVTDFAAGIFQQGVS